MQHVFRTRALTAALLITGALALPAAEAPAHESGITPVEATLSGGRLELVLHLDQQDILETVLGDQTGRKSFETGDQARAALDRILPYAASRVEVTGEGQRLTPCESPRGAVPDPLFMKPGGGEPVPAPVVVRLTYCPPPGRAPEAGPGLSLRLSLYAEADFSPVYRIRWASSGGERMELARAFQAVPLDLAGSPGGDAERPMPLPAFVARFIGLGFTHILPLGLDHILFVLGLFLLAPRLGTLVKQITAFTAAHSLTLALGILGVVRLPGRVVEPIIALSISFIAVENLFVREVRPWRWVVVFGFGLIHGLGFAGVLGELGFPGSRLIPALAGFNAGVELAQLSIVGLAVLICYPLRGRTWYTRCVTVPACLGIAGVGLVWTVQRIWG